MPFTKTALTAPAARCLHDGTVNTARVSDGDGGCEDSHGDCVNDGDGGCEDSDGDCGNGGEAFRMAQSKRLFVNEDGPGVFWHFGNVNVSIGLGAVIKDHIRCKNFRFLYTVQGVPKQIRPFVSVKLILAHVHFFIKVILN